MGQDKGSLRFGAESLLERVIRRLAPVTSDLVVAAGADQSVPEGVRVVRDPLPGLGPLPALIEAVEALRAETAFVVACDTPLLEPALVGLLDRLCVGREGAVPVVGERRVPTCALFRTDALQGARASFGEPGHRSLRAYIERMSVREVTEEELRTVDPGLLTFTPCNTPDEYRRALRLAGFPVNEAAPPTV